MNTFIRTKLLNINFLVLYNILKLESRAHIPKTDTFGILRITPFWQEKDIKFC